MVKYTVNGQILIIIDVYSSLKVAKNKKGYGILAFIKALNPRISRA